MALGEWDQRQLCPDDGCIGVIGPDGTCKVCGRAAQNWGDERKRGLIDPPADEEDEEYIPGSSDEDDEDDEDGEDDKAEDREPDDDTPHQIVAAGASPGDWGSRQLCPDGACIGVIGLDGKCKVCGRATSGPQAAAPVGPTAAVEAPPGDQPGHPASDLAVADTVTAGDPDSTKPVRCSDPTCAGVSRPDGHCERCGKVVT